MVFFNTKNTIKTHKKYIKSIIKHIKSILRMVLTNDSEQFIRYVERNILISPIESFGNFRK